MKIQPYVEKLGASEEFKQFKEQHNDAYLAAGFFIIDLEANQSLHQIDYYIPSEKKVAAFTLDDQIKLQILDTVSEKKPEPLSLNTNIDLDAIEGILEDEMKNRNITESIKKIIAVIQTVEGKKLWSINSVLSGMDILKAHVEDESKTVLKMEKDSIMNYMKRLPAAMQPQKPEMGDLDDQIKKLSDLKTNLDKELHKLEEEKQKRDKSEDVKNHEALDKEKNEN